MTEDNTSRWDVSWGKSRIYAQSYPRKSWANWFRDRCEDRKLKQRYPARVTHEWLLPAPTIDCRLPGFGDHFLRPE